jgi:DNA mismatch endonuclease (patch repair protein)
MADRVDAATRSRIMRAIRSRDTKPELAVRAALVAAGVEHCTHETCNGERLPGRPDIVVYRVRLAVFVHGCYWHLCPLHYKAPASQGWLDKMDANRRRDIRVRRQLRRLGWRTMVVWEHEDAARAAQKVKRRAERLRTQPGGEQ